MVRIDNLSLDGGSIKFSHSRLSQNYQDLNDQIAHRTSHVAPRTDAPILLLTCRVWHSRCCVCPVRPVPAPLVWGHRPRWSADSRWSMDGSSACESSASQSSPMRDSSASEWSRPSSDPGCPGRSTDPLCPGRSSEPLCPGPPLPPLSRPVTEMTSSSPPYAE